MSNYIQLLPEELIQIIYKQYFKKYIISEITNKCFRKYSIGGLSKSCFHCNLQTIDSAFCMFCHHEFQNQSFS